jgi:hypothetical protein
VKSDQDNVGVETTNNKITETLWTILQKHTAPDELLRENGDIRDENSFLPPKLGHNASATSLPLPPSNESNPKPAGGLRPASVTPQDVGVSDPIEVERLRLQLAHAQERITHLEAEKHHSLESGRATPALGQFSNVPASVNVSPISNKGPFLGGLYHPTARAPLPRDNSWGPFDDSRSDTSDALSAGGFNRGRGIWASNKVGSRVLFHSSPANPSEAVHGAWALRPNNPTRFNDNNNAYGPYVMPELGHRAERPPPESSSIMRPTTGRRGSRFESRIDSRMESGQHLSAGYGPLGFGTSQYEAGLGFIAGPNTTSSAQGSTAIGMSAYPQYSQQSAASMLSPHATEFMTAHESSSFRPDAQQAALVGDMSKVSMGPTQPLATEGQTYLPATEPLNYRRLLDRNVTCDWKYIVDKIVCNNDQQASIFLQQKLKVGTPEQKYDIVEAIVAQAYPLMVNRFGNFLVQRCFEHGTPEQVIKIAEAIRGNTLNLSMDPFGCHVVQKAFDSVPEDYKAIMVHELLRRIPETVIHRYACHVWQKLFELRWTETPPKIMKYVNEALCGMWHEVALGETGSLVVQNIFENCLEEDKVCHPCLLVCLTL